MSSKVRPHVADLAVTPDPLTIRSLTEWYKIALDGLDDAWNVEEQQYLNVAWVDHVTKLAAELEVPASWLAAAIFELATGELRMLHTAQAEARPLEVEAQGGAENFAAETTDN